MKEKLDSFQSLLYPDPDERILVIQPELAVASSRIEAKRKQLELLVEQNKKLEGENNHLLSELNSKELRIDHLQDSIRDMKSNIVPEDIIKSWVESELKANV